MNTLPAAALLDDVRPVNGAPVAALQVAGVTPGLAGPPPAAGQPGTTKAKPPLGWSSLPQDDPIMVRINTLLRMLEIEQRATERQRLARGWFYTWRHVIVYAILALGLAAFAAHAALQADYVSSAITGTLTAAAVFLAGMATGWQNARWDTLWLCAKDSLDEEVAAEERRRAAAAPCELAIDLPAHVLGEGFLYVIEFSSGVVKVGRTEDPHRRLLNHRRDALAFGVALTRFWVSPPHANNRSNELDLIEACCKVSSRVRQEYFHDIAFAAAVEIAEGLPFRTLGATRGAAS